MSELLNSLSKKHTSKVMSKLEQLIIDNPNNNVWLSDVYHEYDEKTDTHYSKQDMGIVPDSEGLSEEELYKVMSKLIGRPFTIFNSKRPIK